MEPQIATGTHHGPGFDVPEQGLHLRRLEAGWHGVLDTSMGPVAVDVASPPDGDNVSRDETVVGVPEQFVSLDLEDGVMRGTIRTQTGDVPFQGRRHGEQRS